MSKKDCKLLEEAMMELKPGELMSKIPTEEKGMNFVMRYLDFNDGKAYTSVLAKEMHTSTASISKVINKLEKKKYVKRVKSKEDSRKTEIVLTNLGIKHNTKMRENKDKFSEYILKNMSIEELLDFINTAKKLKSIIHKGIKEGVIK